MEKMDEILRETLNNLKTMLDTDSIIGKPIVNGDGTLLLPVSKISCGFVAGGGEYSETQPKSKQDDYPHAAAGAGGITITPVGFLVCGREKRFLSVDKTTENKWTELLRAALNTLKKDEE